MLGMYRDGFGKQKSKGIGWVEGKEMKRKRIEA
jgi:hypothetical protein